MPTYAYSMLRFLKISIFCVQLAALGSLDSCLAHSPWRVPATTKVNRTGTGPSAGEQRQKLNTFGRGIAPVPHQVQRLGWVFWGCPYLLRLWYGSPNVRTRRPRTTDPQRATRSDRWSSAVVPSQTPSGDV